MLVKFFKKASIFAIIFVAVLMFVVVESFAAARNRGAPSVPTLNADVNTSKNFSIPALAPVAEQITNVSLRCYIIDFDTGDAILENSANKEANLTNDVMERPAEWRLGLVYSSKVKANRQIMQTSQTGEILRL